MAGETSSHRLFDSDALERASGLFYAAEYSQCLHVLDSCPQEHQYLLLRARAFYRLQRYDEAAFVLDSHLPNCDSSEEQLLYISFGAVIAALRRDKDALAKCFSRALPTAVVACSETVRTETALNLALAYWMGDERPQSERYLELAEHSTVATHAATALAIRSLLAASRQAYELQSQLLIRSIRASLDAPVLDVGFIANSLHMLAALCREISVPDAMNLATSTEKLLRWTPDIALSHFQTLRCLAWANALHGQYITAVRYLHRAEELTIDRHRRMLSLLDRAWIATVSNEPHTAAAALSDADDLIRTVDWHSASGEECTILLVAAELFAPRTSRRSRELLEIFEEISGSLRPNYSFAHDDRLRALHEYASAVTLFCENAVSKSRGRAKIAYEIFARIGYDWRAARTAFLLYRGGAGTTWLDEARQKAKKYPRSFVAEEVRAAEKALRDVPAAGALTPRRREILDLLCQGLTIDQIAAQLHKSPNTIKVHIQRLHRDLGVRNRVELIRKASPSA